MRSLSQHLLRALDGPHTVKLPEKLKSFLVRVQLANSSNYDDLHEAMLELGFERELVSQNGDYKQLPDAMYFLANQPEYLSAETVHEKVEKAIKMHKKRTDQPNITAQTLVVAVSDAWFDLDNVADG